MDRAIYLRQLRSFPEHIELPLCQELSQYIYNLLICRNVLKNHCSLLDPVSDEVVPDINMPGTIMEHWILREFETTMIVTVNHGSVQSLICKLC